MNRRESEKCINVDRWMDEDSAREMVRMSTKVIP